ncbi:hypothetical protein [Georgenia sp. H159]|uniref:hypothetical protein n=1 Tax=Georgenia sp. H159 TaxID=3076115 RepID=UPI002D79EDE1|nr:hypothetical protein [Georgenia sp. H159]
MTAPIEYVRRMIEYHADHEPYRWLRHDTSPPLAPLTAPLPEARVLQVTLAGVHHEDEAPFSVREDTTVRVLPTDADPTRLRIAHFGFKLERAQADVGTVFPYRALRALVRDGLVGSDTGAAVSMMGAVYSQRRVREQLTPALLEAVAARDPDLVLLLPACPLDHQTAGSLARAVETSGIPTVVLAGARDITALVRPPRSVYVHAPLGWLTGMPGDLDGQAQRLHAILEAGLTITESGHVFDLPPRYPLGAGAVPPDYWHPDLTDWEEREFARGYVTGGVR